MKTFNEIVEEARLWAQENPDIQQVSTSSIRPEVSSLPQTRAFVNKVLELCNENGIRIKDTERLVNHASFSAQFTSRGIDDFLNRKNFSRKDTSTKDDLMKFATQVAGDSKEGDLLRYFTPETDGLSTIDDDFMYKAYLVRTLAKQESEKSKDLEENFYMLDYEIAVIADECYEIEIENIKKHNNGQLLKNTENNNRSIAVIIGPPGAGKSSVKANLNEGYFSVDLDEIAIYIKNKKNIDLTAHKDAVYSSAGLVANMMMKRAFKEGFNVTVEKIGHAKSEIYGFTESYKNIARDAGCEPHADLYCVHTSNKASTVRAMKRTMDQISGGKELRFYDDVEVYAKDNAPAYSYLDILKDQLTGENESVFDSMMIRINEGLSEEEAVLENLSFNSKTREQKKEVIATLKQAQVQAQKDAMRQTQKTAQTNENRQESGQMGE